jgi:DNA-binding MarR family transcriptional regulator
MAAEPADQGSPALEGDLGWALGVVFRGYAQGAEKALSSVPGGPRGFQVLHAALDEEAGTQREVARRLGIDRTVMTYLLDDLERAGLLRRTPDPLDRRARRLAVTPAGRERLVELQERMAGVEEGLLDGLPDDERRVVRHGLRRIAERLASACPPGADRCTETAATIEACTADGC